MVKYIIVRRRRRTKVKNKKIVGDIRLEWKTQNMSITNGCFRRFLSREVRERLHFGKYKGKNTTSPSPRKMKANERDQREREGENGKQEGAKARKTKFRDGKDLLFLLG